MNKIKLFIAFVFILGNTIIGQAQETKYLIFYTDGYHTQEEIDYRIISEIIPIKSKYCVSEGSLAQRVMLGYSGKYSDYISSVFGNTLTKWEEFVTNREIEKESISGNSKGLLIDDFKIAKKKWKELKKEMKKKLIMKSFKYECN